MPNGCSRFNKGRITLMSVFPTQLFHFYELETKPFPIY
jgi:hypothetical protein